MPLQFKLTKYVHACLLLESEKATVLIDPGQMSFESGLFTANSLQRLDAIAITHEHFDHFYLPFVQQLVQWFPHVKIVSPSSLKAQLTASGIHVDNSTQLIHAQHAQHESMEPLSGGVTADNILVDVLGVLTHPGDSYQVDKSKAIFALPLAGPWGSAIDGIKLSDKLHPKYIMPIHDWMWNDHWRISMYERCEVYFAGKGISFLKPTDGQTISLTLE
ncbi:MBL fold metallo-hydrolase [Candidatus Saccharibacteria bacterium]|nr:MBL fold metallo-hydrolase [Candidatus Saccharibacteria bacterium]